MKDGARVASSQPWREPAVAREGQRPVVNQEVPVALEVRETQPVGRLTKRHEAGERVRTHGLVVVEILLLEDIRRMQRETVANALRDARRRRVDGRSGVRRALVRGRGVETDSRRLGLQLSDDGVELLRENATQKEVALTDADVCARIQSCATDALHDREWRERRHREEGAGRRLKR